MGGVADVGVAQTEVSHLASLYAERGAVVVGHADGGVPGNAGSKVARTQVMGGVFANLGRPRLGVPVGQQLIQGNVVEIGVAIVRLAVGEGEFGGLYPAVQVVGCVVSERRCVHRSQDSEVLKEGRPLRPGGALVDVQLPVLQGDGFLDDRVPFGHVFQGQQTLMRDTAGVLDRVVVDELDYLLGNTALVVFVACGLDSGDTSPALGLLFGGAEGAQHRAEVGVAD